MRIRNYCVLAGVLLAGVLFADEAEEQPVAVKSESSFYKGPGLFSTRANESKEKQPIEHFGPVGIRIDLLLPPFQMQLSRIDKGSPAEASGKLKVGQMIESINGQTLKDIDPRIQLGAIITQAEATDGVIKFMVKDTPDAKAQEVIVNIPVLGAYSKTWPLNCPKSDKIVRNQADFLARSGNHAGPGLSVGLLYMLSTGEEQDLEVARRWVRERTPKTPNNDPINVYPWYLGYGGPGLCEYYLRTGDETVIPEIEKIADYLKRNMTKGGWNQKGGLNFGYGHMNAAGVHCATFLLLARECGAKVDEYTLQESLKQFYRFAGHGNVAYGDQMPEDGFVDNGKTGGLAFTMAAAAGLTPEGENSVYARARDISAVKSFYSTSWMLHGHTGGGIGEIWRSAAMGLMADKAPLKYREFMDNRQWFYEMSRHHDGSMGILSANIGNGGRYDDPRSWGIGLAWTYTIPRKTLRITGAPPTKFSKPYQLPKRPWGTEADEAFLSCTSTADKDGKIPDWSAEKLATDASWPIGRRLGSTNVTDAVLLQYARHPDQGVRQMAAQAIGRQESDRLTLELLKDKDPRVRQAGCMAIGTRTAPPARYEPPRAERLTDEMAQLLLGMVNDPDESWWVVQSALRCLGNAKAELLVPHVDRLAYWLEHEDWWLQDGALSAVQGLVTDKRCYQKLLPRIGKLIATNQNKVMIWLLHGIAGSVREADPEVQALALQVLAQAYADIPQKLIAPGGYEMKSTLANMIGQSASTLASHPGGVEKLLDLSRKRYPDEPLPHKDLFLKADTSKLGPEVKAMVNSIVRDQFIPEYVANNIVLLMSEAQPEPVVVNGLGKVEGLVDLYRKMGVNDYDWRDFGPVRNEMKWDYFNFDPPEAMPFKTGQTRYRKVTYPAGMENWFAVDFDAKKAGWQTGLQPFGQDDGKMRTGIKPFIDQDADRNPNRRGPCNRSFCRCCEPLNTFWEKEVLLIRGTFTLPKFKEGHRYRLVIGGLSHMNTGDGVRVYVNGKQVLERTAPFPKREGGGPIVVYINKDNLAEFQSGPVTIAATGFLKVQLRSKLKTGFMAIWFQEMQMPPLDQDTVTKAAMIKPMLSSDWQALQGLADTNAAPAVVGNPEGEVAPEEEEAPEEDADSDDGKFRWDGKFIANPAMLGTWTTVALVPTVDAFDPAKPAGSRNAQLKAITFKDGGQTDSASTLWSGDTLINIARSEALKMTLKDGYLFIETGGFSGKNPVGWKSSWVVMQRK